MIVRELTLLDVVEFITGWVKVKTAPDQGNDFAGRLSSTSTFFLLIMFAFLLLVFSWFGSPIKCWVPAHFTKPHRRYTDNYCWVKNTYYLPFYEEIPGPDEER